ncbi:hypothetical protein PRIPAC_84200, partial [Pristionchus pacificus]
FSMRRLTKKLVNGLTIAAFPLQLISFGYFITRNTGFIVFFLFSIITHLLYYYRVIRNEEHQYKSHFFYYQVSVAVIQGFMFSTDWHSSLDNIFSIQYWLLVLPWIVQATTCIITYLHDRKAEADGTPTNLYDEEKEEQFKKTFVIAVVSLAFPMQLIFFGLTIAFSLGEIFMFGSIVLLNTSVFMHVRYYLKVVRRGEKQYKTLFFYFEMAVAFIQAFAVTSPFSFSFNLFSLFMIFQVIACCGLYFHSEKTIVSSGLPSYSDVIKNEIDGETKKEKTELPVYSVELKKEIVPVA